MSSFKPITKQRTIIFSPDGKYLISSGYDSTVNYWEPFTGKIAKTFRSPGGFVRDISFHPKYQKQMYLLCTDSAIYLYHLDTGFVTRYIKINKSII
jgi:WD40 repeat protein